MGIRSDAELLSILQRTRLLPTSSSSASLSAENKYSLDVQIGDEGILTNLQTYALITI